MSDGLFTTIRNSSPFWRFRAVTISRGRVTWFLPAILRVYPVCDICYLCRNFRHSDCTLFRENARDQQEEETDGHDDGAGLGGEIPSTEPLLFLIIGVDRF